MTGVTYDTGEVGTIPDIDPAKGLVRGWQSIFQNRVNYK